MKKPRISSSTEAEQLIESVSMSAQRALSELAKIGEGKPSLGALWAMKFEPVGCDPLNAEKPLNLIEQLNQSFTYIASARAVKVLLRLHPELAPFELNLGTEPGWDIESSAGERLVAEVFAAVNTSNNRKLVRDRARVAEAVARHKYVFFLCPGYEESRQPNLERGGVQVWSLNGSI